MTDAELRLTLNRIGFFGEIRKNRTGNSLIPCPLAPWTHAKGVDSNPSLSVKLGTDLEWTLYKCWTCKNAGRLWHLIYRYANYTKNPELLEFAYELLDTDRPSTAAKLRYISDQLDDFVFEGENSADFSTALLDSLLGYRSSVQAVEYLRRRDISLDVADKYDLLYDDTRNRLVFPVYSRHGKFRGAVGRLISGEGVKYYNYFNFYAGNTLGGVNKISEECTKVCVVEGFFDVLNLESKYSTSNFGTVCTWTAGLTKFQAEDLISLDKNLYLCYDMDDPGISAGHRALDMLKDRVFLIKRLAWEGDVDPGSMTVDQVKALETKTKPIYSFGAF